MNYENKDLQNIITPVDVDKYEQLLKQSGYDEQKTDYLVKGFRYGFSVRFQGKVEGKRVAPNLKLRVGSEIELWNKVMTEVKAKRYAGPFKEPPFKDFIQSPIGLVPKDKGKKTRLIFHLSYPKRGNTSVNSQIPHEYCTVRYPDFEEAVKLCMSKGDFCYLGKSDMSMAFRHVPLSKSQWCLMIIKAKHPKTGEIWWFLDKCLPFGCSISCKIFQDFSDSVAYLVSYRTKEPNINYLDDFLFAAMIKALCDAQLQHFLDVCREICFPVSLEKTEWGTNMLTFLGLLLDAANQVVCVPIDKIAKALELLEYFLDKNRKKGHCDPNTEIVWVPQFLMQMCNPW